MICTVVVSKEDDTYIAKDLRTNVVDEGTTVEEALSNLKDALELFYDDYKETIPSNVLMYTTSLEVCV